MPKVRKCPKGHQLLPRMYWKGGAYYHVKRNKWVRLASTYNQALRKYSDIDQPRTDWGDLVSLVYDTYERRYRDGDLAENTWQQYSVIRPRLVKGFAHLRPHEIIPRDITAFLDLWEAKPNMANRMLSVLRVIFERGCRVGACDFNPTVGIKRFHEKKRTRYVTDGELAAIIDNANPHTRAIIRMAYLTGQRIGDILKIKRSDITEEGIAFTQEKTGTRLMVQMTPALQAVIDEAKALRKVPCAYLFHPRGKGTSYSYRAIRDCFERAAAKAMVEKCTLHDIRAKSLTDVKRAGGDATALAGHSFESTTKRYIRGRETALVSGPVLESWKAS